MKKFSRLICSLFLVCCIAACFAACTREDKENGNDSGDAPNSGTFEEETAAGIDKDDHFTWFDVNKTDLPDLTECQKISAGMTLNQVIRAIGKPQRDIGYGTWIFQFDVADGSVLTVSFVLGDEMQRPETPTYDCLIVSGAGFDREIPDVYFPFKGTLNELYPWIDELKEEDIVKVRSERSAIGVAPGHLKNISYSTDGADIQNVYRLLFSTLYQISSSEGQMDGGGYVQYDFFTNDSQTFSIKVANNTVFLHKQYYKFVDYFSYVFKNPELDCHSFITYVDRCEIYTYANESVKIGDFEGLGEIEFEIYEGIIETAPKFRLKSFAVNLLILSKDQFVIEGEDNTIIYRITGEKDFSALFADGN